MICRIFVFKLSIPVVLKCRREGSKIGKKGKIFKEKNTEQNLRHSKEQHQHK